MRKEIILIGGGGHCRSCIDVIETEGKFNIAGIIDIKENLHRKVFQYEVIATDDDLADIIRDYKYFFVTIGHIKSVERRVEIYNYLKKSDVIIPTIISPIAHVSKHASIDEGTIIMHNVIVNSSARIGKNCIINSGAIIEHDAVIGDHCHISTGAIVNGGCIIMDEVFIGSRSVLFNNISVTEGTIIGAGSVIMKTIKDSGIYAGNPARKFSNT